MPSPDQITTGLQVLGVTGLLVIALLAFYKGWVYTGSAYRALEKDRDEWKQMALDGLKTTADIAVAAKKHTTLTPEEAEAAIRIIEAGRK